MSRHARPVDRARRGARVGVLATIWLGGIASGYEAILAAVAKYGCADADRALACRTSGSLVGALLIVLVIIVITTVTVLTFARPVRPVIVVGAFGLVGLAACFVAAHTLLDSL